MRRPSPSQVHRSLPLVLVTTAFVVVACHDAAGPLAPTIAPSAASAAAPPGSPLVVWPQDMHGWSFVHDVRGTPCTDVTTCRLVAGPATPPLGTGSLELASTAGTEVSALLSGQEGVRLARISALRYSTFQRRGYAGAGAAIALELDVQYDVTDAAQGDVGRLVSEPTTAGAQPVVADAWQSWDARAGLWWTTRGAARAGDGPDGHPCVQASPCTWRTLLERFPNIGIAPTGGVLLTARRGATFRGNADSVVVGIDGVNTVYDFELEYSPVKYPLARTIEDGVLVDRLTADAIFRAGTTLDYAFSSRPGRSAPMVILDDTLVLPASGTLLMDGAHALHVLSDTVYAYATLTPLERAFADLTASLLVAGDKVAAAQAISDRLVSEVNAGTPAELLARAVHVAQRVVIDPQRDSAALDAVDAALVGRDFNFGYAGTGRLYSTTSRGWPVWKDPVSASPSVVEPLPASPPSPASPPAPTSLAGRMLAPTGVAMDRVANASPENPQENTRVIYTNGVWTQYTEALASATLLATLVYAEPRFANYRTAVTLHYNPTRSVEMKRYDAAHPCTLPFMAATSFASYQRRLLGWAICSGKRYATALTSNDLVESITARFQLELSLPPTNDAVVGLSRMVAAYRAIDSHVLLVGHSEGVIVQAAAVRLLPDLERHPLQVAPRCVAVLALAPPTQRESYGMDEYHLKGLLAMQDIIRVTQPTGWEDIDTPLSQRAREAMSASPVFAPLLAATYGVEIHSVNTTYLAGNVAPVVRARLVTLHRECMPGAGELTLSSSVVPLQQTLTAHVDVWNQNNRPLIGRRPDFAGVGYLFDRVDSTTFRAMVPYDGQIRIIARVTPGLDLVAPTRIPLLRPAFTIRDTPLSEWVAIAAGGASAGAPSAFVVPTEMWDGTIGACTKTVRVYNAEGDWADFERRCNHVYTPVYERPDTLPTGRRIVGASVYYTYANGTTMLGPPVWTYCSGEAACITSGYVEWIGEVGVVGRSGTTLPTISAARLSSTTGFRASGAAPLPEPTRNP